MDKKASQTQNTSAWRTLILENLRSVTTVFVVGAVIATLFTAATPPALQSTSFTEKISAAINQELTPTAWPTATPRPRPVIGIIVGHTGKESQIQDPGAICPAALGNVHEAEVNQAIAAFVKQQMEAEGFDIDLLEEFDSRLPGYKALALVSIHADSCEYQNPDATGFKISPSTKSPGDQTARLTACIRRRYREATGLQEHPSITPGMRNYHVFSKIDPTTPAVILEVGFLNLDHEILTKNPERIAQGISNGLLCYVHNEGLQ